MTARPKTTLAIAVALGTLATGGLALGEWGDPKTTHIWDWSDTNGNGSSDCPNDYADGSLTPGRPSGGWFEWRFLPTGWNAANQTWPLASNPGVFTQIYTQEPTRRCPMTFNEYTTGHVHGVLNARLAQYKGKIFAVYDSVGGYYSRNGISLQEDPSQGTANSSRPYVITEMARNPRRYIDTNPGKSALYSFNPNFDYNNNGVLDWNDGCDYYEGHYESWPVQQDNKVNGYYVIDPKWRDHTGINHEKFFCAPPAMTQTFDPDIVIRNDPSLATDPNAKAFVIWSERYAEGSSADMPNGWDPQHPKPPNLDSWPFRRLGVHVQMFNANDLSGGKDNVNPGWISSTPLTATNSSDVAEDGEPGLRYYADRDVISPRITALKVPNSNPTQYLPLAVWGENTLLNTTGEYGQDQQMPAGPHADLFARIYTGVGTSWGAVEPVGYVCEIQTVSSGRATGRKKSFGGTHDVEVWTNNGEEEALVVGSFWEGGSNCNLKVKRRASNGSWSTLGNTIATAPDLQGNKWPRLTVYKNNLFVVYTDNAGYVHVSTYVAASGTWQSMDYGSGWNASTIVAQTNPLKTRGPSISVTSASNVTNSGVDPYVTVRVAYHQNEPGSYFQDDPVPTTAEGVWGVAVASCKAVWTGSWGYRCAHAPKSEARSYRENYNDYIADYLDVYKPTKFGLGVSWGTRDVGAVSLSGSSSWGAATLVDQFKGWKPDLKVGLNRIPGQPSSTDLISDGTSLTHDGQATSVHLAFTGPIGNHRESDRGLYVKENKPMRGAQYTIATGAYHTIAAVGGTNKVYTWGRNKYGALGNGQAVDAATAVPQAVTIGVASDPVVKVAASYYGSGALTKSGKLYMWGYNQYGTVCTGDYNTPVTAPALVSGANVFIDFALGNYHAVALRSDGTVWTCGYNYYGQLGVNNGNANTNTWTQVLIEPGSGYFTGGTLVVAGGNHTCVNQDVEGLYCFGKNSEGQLGTNDNTQYPYAKKVYQPIANTRFRAAQLAAGQHHTAALYNDNYYTWGYNGSGQLGVGDYAPRLIPTAAYSGTNVLPGATLFAGYQNTYILNRETGNLVATGHDTSGELGDDAPVAPKSTWVSVKTPGWVDNVGAGPAGSHVYATASYTKWRGYTWWQCWGDGQFNKCGYGGTSDQGMPVTAFRPDKFPCAASVTAFQVFGGIENFADVVVGCAGVVNYVDRPNLCAPGTSVTQAVRWGQITSSTTFPLIAPTYHYWTNDPLKWGGTTSNNCYAGLSAPNSCTAGQPMRACASAQTDPLGNYCTWTNCDLDSISASTNGYFGGCSGANGATAGTLCNESTVDPI